MTFKPQALLDILFRLFKSERIGDWAPAGNDRICRRIHDHIPVISFIYDKPYFLCAAPQLLYPFAHSVCSHPLVLCFLKRFLAKFL